MKSRVPVLTMAIFFVVVQVIALFLSQLFPRQYQAFPDANNPANPLIYVLMILLVTALVLVLIRYGKQRIIQAIFMFSVFITLFYVFFPSLAQVDQEGWIALFVSIGLAGALVALLLVKGEWYIIDTVGLIVGCGITAILGFSLGILPSIILLIIMAVYDAISVYKTKHMISLAEGVVPMRLPVLFVVPKNKNFRMSDLDNKKIVKEEGGEREAFFMGVGDAVIPGILVVSAFTFLSTSSDFFSNANLLVAIGTILGGLVGFVGLMIFVLRGKPQAGLPFLNTGAIAGYLVSYLLVFQNLGFGLV